MSDLGAAKGRILIDTSDVARAAAEVKRGSQAMTTALQAIGVGVGIQAVKRIAEIGYELAQDAAQAQVTRQAFNSLAESFGQNADDMLSSMRTASKGMISDANLVLDANRAMLLGVAHSAEQMNQLLDVARVRGQAMGMDTAKAFDDLVTGLGRMSPRILDNLGIVGTQKALEDYAASVGTTADELSDAQKQAILFNAVVASSQTLIDASAKAGDNASTKFQQFGAKIENTKKQLGDFLLSAGATDALDTFSTAIDDSITQLKQLDDWFVSLKTDWDNFANNTVLPQWVGEIDGLLKRWEALEGHLGFIIGTRPDDPYAPKRSAADGGGSGGFTGPSGSGGKSGPIPIPASVIDTKALLKAQVDYNKSLGDINRNSNRDIQKATEDAGRQRAETIRSYELGIAREEEDFLRGRARQQRDYEAGIVQIMRDAQARDAKIQSDLADQIGEAQKDSDKRLAEQEADFQKQRQRAQRDFSNELLDAAGDLDAKRVYQLQRDNANHQKDAQEDHNEAIKKERESLAERIDQAQKAAQKQLDDARAADAQRLADMKAALELQRSDEDADRELQRQRAADDQQHALDQQDIEAGLRIQQIIDNAADERMAAQDAFNQQLADLHLHNLAYEEEQKRARAQALKDLAPFMKDWFDTTRAALEASLIDPAGKRPGQTPSMVPAGFGTLPVSAGSTGGGSTYNSRALNGNVSVTIQGSGLSETQLQQAITKALLDAFGEAP